MQNQQPTSEQIDRCTRLIDEQLGEVFYQCESESTDDVYEVHFIPGKGFTCTCPAGASGFRFCRSTCKHCRWSVAHAHEYHEAQKLRGERESEQRELALQAEYDLYQMETYERLIREHPRKPRNSAEAMRRAQVLHRFTNRVPEKSFW